MRKRKINAHANWVMIFDQGNGIYECECHCGMVFEVPKCELMTDYSRLCHDATLEELMDDEDMIIIIDDLDDMIELQYTEEEFNELDFNHDIMKNEGENDAI